jgi:hypothetical protein
MRSWITLLGLLTLASDVQSADYWPFHTNSTYHYLGPNGYTMVVQWTTNSNGLGVVYRTFNPNGALRATSWEQFALGAAGDVTLSEYGVYFEGAFDPEVHYYSPPITFIDMPLTVGQSWLSIGQVYPSWTPATYIEGFTVDRSQTVTVPYGTFDVLVVTESSLLAPTNHGGVHYLNRELGPVVLSGSYELVAIDSPVGVADMTWGAVKALFR